MAVDPYSPCPCGSGQKFKWCCQKVEAYADRAQRLYENKQIEPAIEAIHEGLRKDPHNAWLLTREAVYQISAGRPEAGTAAVRKVLVKNPNHLGALSLLTRLTLEAEGVEAGVAQLQQALSSCPPEQRRALAPLVKFVASFLLEADEYAATLRHLKLAAALDGDPTGAITRAIRGFESRAASSVWLKNPDTLSPPPSALEGTARGRFEEALRWAADGLWSSAAAAFETLSSDRIAGPVADRNLGFCRLWLADHAGAVAALRRYIAKIGGTAEAVDLEALCQLVEPVHPDDLVEHVELVWPIRNRDALMAALQADPTVEAEGQAPSDPDDENSPVVDQFALLDKPALKAASADLMAADIPKVLGRILVGAETVGLVGYDDGRLDALSDRFTALARPAIPSAHPRTKVLDKVARHPLALSWEWLFPEGVEPELSHRLYSEQGSRVLSDVWPNTPMRSLRGRTPLKAAQAGDAEVPLRAAVVQLEQARQDWVQDFDFDALRARLKIPAEPAIDTDKLDISTLHIARLASVPVESLGDDALAEYYRRAHDFGIDPAIERAGRILIERPEVAEKSGIGTLAIYSVLASLAAAKDRLDEAFKWVSQGRQADPPAARAQSAPYWDMLEVRFKAASTPPEMWVPELAVVLDRYADNESASQTVLLSLIEMRLIEMVPHPDQPGQFLIDNRRLQAIIERYGPRVTTASGRLGVSAAKPEIWTPGSDAGAGKPSGGLWTPGSGSPSAPSTSGGASKLIVPGR